MNNARSDARTRAKRNYKDTLFRLVFKERKELLSLYNAINDTAYTDESALEIVTLENAIYMNMKNDLAFLVDCKIVCTGIGKNTYTEFCGILQRNPIATGAVGDEIVRCLYRTGGESCTGTSGYSVEYFCGT